jgi:hypothetical protein
VECRTPYTLLLRLVKEPGVSGLRPIVIMSSLLSLYGVQTSPISVACNEDHVVVSIETLQAEEFDATT